MKSFFRSQAILIAILLVCTACTYTVTAAQGGCDNLPTPSGLINGSNKDGVIPVVRASSGGTIH